MADAFNAYHKWLGIPPKDQPPNLYRLLGVELFEADPDVISAAADQRMVFLRSFQSAKQGAAAEALLNEIAAARICLLLPQRREQYDRELRAKISTLPAPRALTPGAVQHERSLADERSTARDTKPLPATDTQEVPLATAPLPGKPAVPPPRKTGPLPLAAAVKSPALPLEPLTRPLPPATAPMKATPAKPTSSPFAELPTHVWRALVYLPRLPGMLAMWLLRTADGALLKLAGEENRILHNFLRVAAPLVLAILLAIGGVLGGSWAYPRIVAAIREQAAQRERELAQQKLIAAPPRITHAFEMTDVGEPLPNLDPLEPFIPPPIPPTNTEPPVVGEDSPLAAIGAARLLGTPTYTAAELQQQILETQTEASYFERVPDADLESLDQQLSGFNYRHAMRDLAHIFTFARDVGSVDRSDVAEILSRGLSTAAKQKLFASRAASALMRPGPDAPGLVACGNVKSKVFHDGLYRTEIELPLQPATTITVVSTANLAEAFGTRSQVVVLGAMVEDPSKQIVGYRGPQHPVVWGGGFFAAPAVSNEVALVLVEPPIVDPAIDPPPEEEQPIAEPIDPTQDLLDLARYGTALQNSGQPLVVPNDHALLARWIALGLVQRERKRSWGPEQVEGPPDTPEYGDRSTAWASASQDTGEEWLELTYAETVTPAKIHVFETHCPGALVAITGLRGDREFDLWRGADPTAASLRGGTSIVDVEKPFPTNRLRIYLDSAAVPGWNEIDAVGIVDSRGRAHWAAAVTASTSYAGEDHPPFVIDREGLLARFNASPALMKMLLNDPQLNGREIDDDQGRRRPKE